MVLRRFTCKWTDKKTKKNYKNGYYSWHRVTEDVRSTRNYTPTGSCPAQHGVDYNWLQQGQEANILMLQHRNKTLLWCSSRETSFPLPLAAVGSHSTKTLLLHIGAWDKNAISEQLGCDCILISHYSRGECSFKSDGHSNGRQTVTRK